jgi:hypothetical protein
MRKLFNLGTFAALLALVLAFGSIDAAAQKRKPVLRKRPVAKRVTAVRAPALYRVDTGTNIRVRMNGTLSSKTARVGDRFKTTVTEPVYSTNGVVVIPVGSTVTGRVDTVTAARKGGKPGEISVSFISVQLPNGSTRAINGSLTDLNTKSAKSDNEGTASGDKMKHRKIIFIGGGGAGGAVLGGAVGGGKGALIGGIIGGIAGAIAENQTKGEDAEVRSGTEFGVYLNQSLSMSRWNEPIN